MEKEKNNIQETDTYLAKWLIGAVSDVELKRLVTTEDFIAYKKMKGGLDRIDELVHPTIDSYQSIQSKIEVKKKQQQKKKFLKWSTAIAASLILFFGLYTNFNSTETILETAQAESKTFQLLDGSQVILNAGSQVSYEESEWDAQRLVNLKGEAFFKVKKGETFTVQTPRGSVLVLGTQFNVKVIDDYFQVTCFEGKVKVISDQKEYILNPTDSFRKINGNEIEEFNSSGISPSWTQGESSFRSVPLKYVIIALEKQYNIKIDANIIDDTQIYTGSFSHNNIEIAFASVFKTMNINYRKIESRNYRLD